MSYISDYKCGAIDYEEYKFYGMLENAQDRYDLEQMYYGAEEDEEEEEEEDEDSDSDIRGFNIIPDSYLPYDCDGVFREGDCEYCIEHDECKNKERGIKA